MKIDNPHLLGYAVGQTIKKIDRTLSFLPTPIRKATVAASVVIGSPLLAMAFFRTSSSEKDSSLFGDVLNVKKAFSETSEAKLNTPQDDEDGYQFGFQGWGYYINGYRVDYDHSYEDDEDS